MSKRPSVYLDYNATSPVDPRVLEAMLPYFSQKFGNAISSSHEYGWEADAAVETARLQVADFLHCLPQEVIFTSGATEGNNWVFRSILEKWHLENPGRPMEIISSTLEHPSVRMNLDWAASQGAKICLLPFSKTGEIDAKEVEKLLHPDTALVSVMWVNNEIASINPISEIAKICKQHKVYFHSDATQAIGKVKFNFQDSGVDLLTFSAHKFYGPKGIGALLARARDPKVKIPSLMLGGGQEKGRSGTVNVPAVVGLGATCKILQECMDSEIQHLRKLQELLWKKLEQAAVPLQLNGPPLGKRAPNNLNLTFKTGNFPVTIPGLAASRGSACSSTGEKTSHVLQALGLSDHEAQNTLRLTLGRFSTETEIEEAAAILSKISSDITV